MNKHKITIHAVLKYTFILFFVIGAVFLFLFRSRLYENHAYVDETIITQYTHPITVAGNLVKVEFAQTPEKLAQGLSLRAPLKEDEGMLFVFDHPDTYTFWMKDMNFSIDIIWFDEHQQVIYMKKNATPASYPKSFGPTQKALYVLEVPSGFVDRNNIQIGDWLESV